MVRAQTPGLDQFELAPHEVRQLGAQAIQPTTSFRRSYAGPERAVQSDLIRSKIAEPNLRWPAQPHPNQLRAIRRTHGDPPIVHAQNIDQAHRAYTSTHHRRWVQTDAIWRA